MTAPSKLLVISGPIAAGKSTVAAALATVFRDSGRTAAVVDLDRIYMMFDDRPPMTDPRISRLARRAAAALTDHFVLDGIELVVVEGTFWTESERDELTGRLTTLVQTVFLTLRVAVEEALRRVEGDTGRRASRNPVFLRASHADFEAVTPITTDAIIDSTSLTVDAVVAASMAMLEHVSLPDTNGALFNDVDCVQIPVPDLDAGLAFYRDALGHELIWRTPTAAGLQMTDSPSEIVIQTERPELEVNFSTTSADAAARRLVEAGGTLIVPPFDIAIGRCVVAQDPWGNRLVMLDHTRGRLLINSNREVRSDRGTSC
jgi:lactoylglutathione lyase